MAFNMAYLKRLGLHGGRLAWRVLMILASVTAYSLWEMIKHPPVALNQDDEHPVIGSHLEAVDAFHEGKIGAAEMAYYDSVYGD
jgi:hypothetical protein